LNLCFCSSPSSGYAIPNSVSECHELKKHKIWRQKKRGKKKKVKGTRYLSKFWSIHIFVVFINIPQPHYHNRNCTNKYIYTKTAVLVCGFAVFFKPHRNRAGLYWAHAGGAGRMAIYCSHHALFSLRPGTQRVCFAAQAACR
jgi:hypothetical protein